MSKEAGGARQPRVGASERIVATAVANRVASVNTIFFGRLRGVSNTDTFDVNQGVELMWRQFSGLPRASELRRTVRASLPRIRELANGSALAGREVAHLAVDAVEVLLDERISDRECLRRVVGIALGVALQFDDAGAEPPEGFLSWAAYELSGHAAYLDMLVENVGRAAADLSSLLRTRSGEDSMQYRYALKQLLR